MGLQEVSTTLWQERNLLELLLFKLEEEQLLLAAGRTRWLARATRDDGRTARLHAAGAFDAMPQSIEHGIVAVARQGQLSSSGSSVRHP